MTRTTLVANALTAITLTFVMTTASVSAIGPDVDRAEANSYTVAQQELVDFAYGRFARADLELPTVTVVFPTDNNQCHGYGGVYLPAEHTVRICRPSKTTMVHELAHAWVETTLTNSGRHTFLQLRGLDTWTDAERWDQRGAEHAAEIITWALMDRNIAIRWIETNPDGTTAETSKLYKLPDSSPNELITAYEQLTGKSPTDRLPTDPLADDRNQTTTDSISPEARRG